MTRQLLSVDHLALHVTAAGSLSATRAFTKLRMDAPDLLAALEALDG